MSFPDHHGVQEFLSIRPTMNRFRTLTAAFMLCAIALAACGDKTPKQESVETFYRGKTLTIVVGSSVGGGYDNTARLVARHLGRHIPGNPSFIVENMPGAGSVLAANHVYNSAPKDGTVLGIFVDSVPLSPLWKQEGTRYDPREVGWLGSLASRAYSSVVIMRSDAKVKSFADAKKMETALGSAGGPYSTTTIYPWLLNELVGTKFKIIYGYPGGAEVMLALERGEIEGYAGMNWHSLKKERPAWVENKFVIPIVQMTLESDPALPHVPLAIDDVHNEIDRQVMELALGLLRFARVFSVAPGIPQDRLAALRKAFDDMTKDPEFAAEADKVLLEGLTPSSHQAIEQFIREAYAVPEEVRSRAAKYMGGK